MSSAVLVFRFWLCILFFFLLVFFLFSSIPDDMIGLTGLILVCARRLLGQFGVDLSVSFSFLFLLHLRSI